MIPALSSFLADSTSGSKTWLGSPARAGSLTSASARFTAHFLLARGTGSSAPQPSSIIEHLARLAFASWFVLACGFWLDV